MKNTLTALIVLLLSSLVLGGQLSQNTGLILTDTEGKTYDIDNLLDQGKHIGVVSTGSG